MKRIVYLVLCTGLTMTSACVSQKVNTIVNSKAEPIVIPPNCPDWSVGNNVNYSNTPSSNYGCATVNNYGAMIDDPNDMVIGKSTNFTNGARSAASVSSYEAGGGGGAVGATSSSSTSQ